MSLPTMPVAFDRYSRDSSFQVLAYNKRFVAVLAAGSIIGTIIGDLLLGAVAGAALIPLLVGLLCATAVKIRRYA